MRSPLVVLQKPDQSGAPGLIAAGMKCRDRWLDLTQPVVMGILNITPDSFSDGGRFIDASGRVRLDDVEEQASCMVSAGAKILDIGGESTRPGAPEVSSEQEMERVIPVMERLRSLDTLLSVDTRKGVVAEAALAAGCHLVNDVSAGIDETVLHAVSRSGAGLCLMHMRGEPATMQHAPEYLDVLSEIGVYLADRVKRAIALGIDRQSIVIDPGIGFGKTMQHNLRLLANLERFAEAGLPILVGVSRKSFLGRITNRPVEERLYASIAMAVLAVEHGARIIRAHDVAETYDALSVWTALNNERTG